MPFTLFLVTSFQTADFDLLRAVPISSYEYPLFRRRKISSRSLSENCEKLFFCHGYRIQYGVLIQKRIREPILAGSELGKGYSELNDPIEQAERFLVQQKLLAGGDEEAMMSDDSFVEMLEHAMPPTCGFGFGERLFAFLVDKPIRETQLFPLVKPK